MNIVLFVLIFVCPGLIIAFSTLTRSLDGYTRLLLSAALSFPIVTALFLALSASGLTLDQSVKFIAIAGLLSTVTIAISRRSFTKLGYRQAASIIVALAVPVLIFVAIYATSEPLYFWGHAWLHVDIIYSLMDAPFAPEDKQLAGLSRTYPWHVHAYFLVQSAALNMAPVTAFPVINLACLVVFLGFGMKIVHTTGGGRVAIFAAPFLFAFALNPIGVLAKHAALEWSPTTLAPWSFLLGDPRYDFMAIKFVWLTTHKIGLVLAAALAYLSILPDSVPARSHAILIALVTLALVIVYPLYLPVAFVLIGARCAAIVSCSDTSAQTDALKRAILLVLLALFAAAVGYLLVTSTVSERTGGLGIRLSTPGEIWRNALQVITAASLPGLAALLYLRSSFSDRPFQTTVLILSAIGFASLAVFLFIPNHKNEYKYVFMAGFVLIPFLCLWVEKLVSKRTIWRFAVVAFLAVICFSGALTTINGRVNSQMKKYAPPLAFDGFDQNLIESDPLASPIMAIRKGTAKDAILLTGDRELHLPTFTQRALYVPYNPERRHVGYLFRNEFVIENVKGIDPSIANMRRTELIAVLDGENDEERIEALRSIALLGRDIVILAEPATNGSLINWLKDISVDQVIYSDDRFWVSVLPVEALAGLSSPDSSTAVDNN